MVFGREEAVEAGRNSELRRHENVVAVRKTWCWAVEVRHERRETSSHADKDPPHRRVVLNEKRIADLPNATAIACTIAIAWHKRTAASCACGTDVLDAASRARW